VLASFEGPTDKQSPNLVASGGVGLVFGAEVAVTLFTDRLTVPSQVAALCSDAAGFSCWRAFFLYANGKIGTISHSGSQLATLGAASVGTANGDAAADAAAIAKEVAASFANASSSASATGGGGASATDFRVIQVGCAVLMLLPCCSAVKASFACCLRSLKCTVSTFCGISHCTRQMRL
jgi:hypothetical protein